MATTTFVNGVTLTDAGWFNDEDALLYDVFNAKATAGTTGTLLYSDGTHIVNSSSGLTWDGTKLVASKMGIELTASGIGLQVTASGTLGSYKLFSSESLSAAGFTVSGAIVNTDNTNAGSTARLDVISGGSSAGDAYTLYTVSGVTVWGIGIDNSDSDKLKIAAGDPSSGAEKLTLTTTGNVVPGTGALATNANDGFVYMESCAGTPTGTPTSFTGRVAFVYDSTNNIIYIYNGAWKKTAALT